MTRAFTTIAPADPPDPFPRLRLVPGTGARPVFAGPEAARALPSVVANDAGLCLWRADFAAVLISILGDEVASTPVDTRAGAGPGPALCRLEARERHSDVLGRGWSGFRSGFLPAGRVIEVAEAPGLLLLRGDVAEELTGRMRPCHVWTGTAPPPPPGQRRANAWIATSADHAAMLAAEPPPARPALTETQAREAALALLASRGGFGLGSNRETWAELIFRDGWTLREGEAGDRTGRSRAVSPDTAWALIRSRLLSEMGVYGPDGAGRVPVTEILARLEARYR